nr:hypothetical protein [uncultured Haemophilus sp.]
MAAMSKNEFFEAARKKRKKRLIFSGILRKRRNYLIEVKRTDKFL